MPGGRPRIRTRAGTCRHGHTLADAYEIDGYLRCVECAAIQMRERRQAKLARLWSYVPEELRQDGERIEP